MTWKRIVISEKQCPDCKQSNWHDCPACNGNNKNCAACSGTNQICSTCSALDEQAEGVMDDARSDQLERERSERGLPDDKEELYQELKRFPVLGE